MKKMIALILSLALIISMATSAMAENYRSSSINKALTSTSVYVNSCKNDDSHICCAI